MVDFIRSQLPDKQQNSHLVVAGLSYFFAGELPTILGGIYFIFLGIVIGYLAKYTKWKVTIVLVCFGSVANIFRYILDNITDSQFSLDSTLMVYCLVFPFHLIFAYMFISIGWTIRNGRSDRKFFSREARTMRPARKSIIFLNIVVVLVILALVLIQI